MNKKGQALSMQTVIIIILAIIVLVVLALNFTVGLQNLWGTIIGTYRIYDQGVVNLAKLQCEGYSPEQFCTSQIPLYNKQIKQEEMKYCYESPINAELMVGDKTLKSEADCVEYMGE